MARRPDPARLYAAHRAGLHSRLEMSARLSPETAERWIVAWESEVQRRHLNGRKPEWWEPRGPGSLSSEPQVSAR